MSLLNIKRDENGRIPSIWTLDSALEEAKKFKTLKDFRLGSPSAYAYISRKKKTDLIEIEKTKRHRLSNWEIFCALKKSESISDFEIRFPKECSAFYKRKKSIDKSAYAHFPASKTGKKWFEHSIIDEAKKYKHRSDFSKLSSGAYDAALKLGILNAVCKHMKPKKSEFNVVYIWTAKKENSYRLVKVGVTSKRLGLKRIKFVEQKSGLKAEEVILLDTEEANQIEANLKTLGIKADIGVFSGSSEFFWVSHDVYEQMIKEMKNGTTDKRMV